ncbi:hypothetical protein QVD17_21990 [Tagetes erecta]|uniref:Uncharacterized protein n=1 Tax=Tagetes erecta TaxID=13708 RepID=A0AAD8KIW7_TARER|nr:hypothetical protein QVD17_21990 [Tagetes erecta]
MVGSVDSKILHPIVHCFLRRCGSIVDCACCSSHEVLWFCRLGIVMCFHSWINSTDDEWFAKYKLYMLFKSPSLGWSLTLSSCKLICNTCLF